MKTKRKGFTLAEILIVLLIIAVLGTVMNFMDREAEASAKVSTIMNGLRNLKSEVLFHRNNSADNSAIISYLNTRLADKDGYLLHTEDGGKTLYIGYKLSDDIDNRIKAKLTAKAESAKLLGSDKKTKYNNDGQVWLQVISIGG